MRIKYIVPFPYGAEGLAYRAQQIPKDILSPGTEVDCVSVRHSGTDTLTYIDLLAFDIYVAEAGLRAEEEGYDAVVMDTMTDSGVEALRSRLTIPVLAPGLVAYTVAAMLGNRFSIVTLSGSWRHWYEENLDRYHLRHKCASIRAVEVPPGTETSPDVKEEMSVRVVAEGKKAIEEDGADVIMLGSTTMHQAAGYAAEHLPCPVINPGTVAIKMAETIVQLGLSHSKVRYPPPGENLDSIFFSLMSATRQRSG